MFVGTHGIIEKYVKTYSYDKIRRYVKLCKIKYSQFHWKLLETLFYLPKLIYQFTEKICIYI